MSSNFKVVINVSITCYMIFVILKQLSLISVMINNLLIYIFFGADSLLLNFEWRQIITL